MVMDFKNKFIEDATELLKELEINILELEKNKNSSALIEEIFRAMHTLKGTAGMYGFANIGTLTHKVENIYDLIRNGRIGVSKEILDLTLRIVDFLNNVLHEKNNTDYNSTFIEFNKKVESIISDSTGEYFDGNLQELEKLSETKKGLRTWFLKIKPTQDLSSRGIKMHLIFEELSEIGECVIFNRANRTPEFTNIFWEVFLATEASQNEISDILLFIEDITTTFSLVDYNLLKDKHFVEKCFELEQETETNIDELLHWIENKDKENTENLTDNNPNAVFENKRIESIKVAADKLDEQMLLLSEFVTANSELKLMVEKFGYENLNRIVEQFDKISRRFRNNIFKIRLIPLESLHLRFDRLIRDLSENLHKEVAFITEGMHTELDKTIIDNLEKPIMHLIRNCLDHGIETADIRKSRGKQPKGIIKLSARQAATNVYIEIEDDGEGINTTKIKEKAIAKGLLEVNEILTDEQLFQYIFIPGFSTARNLTEVSGRGVGMDVVKQAITSLRGTIDIASEKGKFTKFTIRLPLTLSIIDTMLVKSGIMFYSIPLATIKKCIEINPTAMEFSENNHIVVDNKLIPYIHLEKVFKINQTFSKYWSSKIIPENEKSDKLKAVIVFNGNSSIALIVNEVIGEHQAVLKPLGDYFKNLEYISGATQLADGNIAIVLDTGRMIKSNILDYNN